MSTSLADRSELVGFFSYSRDDDLDAGEALTQLRTRIQGELRTQLGRSRQSLRLWQDAEAIAPGTLWESQIDAAVAQSVFFIPIVTPRVVASKYCGLEFDKFLGRERALGRDDLVFPILFVDVGALADERVWRASPILKAIGERQYVDWREFRHDPDSVAVRKAVAQFCAKIVQALRKQVRGDATDKQGADADGTTGFFEKTTRGWPTSSAWAWIAARLRRFDEARLSIDALAIYAVVSMLLISGAFSLLYWSKVETDVFKLATYYPAMAFGAWFGLALALVYVVLGVRVTRVASIVLVSGVGWILLGVAMANLGSFLPASWTWPWLASLAWDTAIFALGGLIGGAIVLAGVATVDRGVLRARRVSSILGTAAVLGGALSLIKLLVASSPNFLLLLGPALLAWQLPVALAIFHGRKDLILAANAPSA